MFSQREEQNLFEALFRIIAQVERNGEGLRQPTPDLLPMVTKLYESFMRQVGVGDIFTVQFRVQRL